MKNFSVLTQFAMVGQFGLSLITPLLICVVGCSYLCAHFSVGGWIFIPGFFLGLGGSCMTAWKTYLAITRKEQKSSKHTRKKRGVSFNRHYYKTAWQLGFSGCHG